MIETGIVHKLLGFFKSFYFYFYVFILVMVTWLVLDNLPVDRDELLKKSGRLERINLKNNILAGKDDYQEGGIRFYLRGDQRQYKIIGYYLNAVHYGNLGDLREGDTVEVFYEKNDMERSLAFPIIINGLEHNGKSILDIQWGIDERFESFIVNSILLLITLGIGAYFLRRRLTSD